MDFGKPCVMSNFLHYQLKRMKMEEKFKASNLYVSEVYKLKIPFLFEINAKVIFKKEGLISGLKLRYRPRAPPRKMDS